jgi:hypothetical protein
MFSDFTTTMLRQQFGIVLRDSPLFPSVSDIIPSPWLRETLQIGQSQAYYSEKARSEFIVAPILLESRMRMQNRISIFSGVTLNTNESGLRGECDFILARTASTIELRAPLMVVVEAKKHDIEQGVGQCGAEMLAASRFNEKDGVVLPFIYGCVTNGENWVFLKLEQNDLLLHPERFPLKEVSKILGFLVQCLNDVDQQVSDAA